MGNGEYLTGIYFAYERAGQIDYIRAQTNKNQQVSMGELTSSMTTSDMTSIHDSRVLAFHGYENARVSAVGQVSVDLGCIKGVTTVESVDEPVLIDIEQLENSHITPKKTEEDEHAWIYILVGVLLGVGLMSVAGLLGYMYKKKKGCWSKAVSIKKTMPIGLNSSMKRPNQDIEFAGQSDAQKRQSIKKMAKIVEVNESNDLEDSDRNKKMK